MHVLKWLAGVPKVKLTFIKNITASGTPNPDLKLMVWLPPPVLATKSTTSILKDINHSYIG